MPLQIQTPVVGQLLQKEFNIVGRVRPALDEIIVPVVNVADLATAAGIPVRRTVVSRWSQAGVVGEKFVMQLVVPPNTLLSLVKLDIWVGTGGGQIQIHHGNALAATPASLATVRFTDGRLLEPFQNPAVFPSYGTVVGGLGAGNFEEQYRIDAAGERRIVDFPRTVVGSGGDTNGFLEIAYSTDNSAVSGTLQWEEFQLT